MSDETTLRDKFAMSALNGLTSNLDDFPENTKLYAESAYKLADAMIEARKEKRDEHNL